MTPMSNCTVYTMMCIRCYEQLKSNSSVSILRLLHYEELVFPHLLNSLIIDPATHNFLASFSGPLLLLLRYRNFNPGSYLVRGRLVFSRLAGFVVVFLTYIKVLAMVFRITEVEVPHLLSSLRTDFPLTKAVSTKELHACLVDQSLECNFNKVGG